MKIVVVDGHPAMRLGLKGLLGFAGDMWVVGETGDGEEALRLVDDLRPHLVVLGLNLTGETCGVEGCLKIKALLDPPRVLVYASQDFNYGVSSYLLAGADGVLHKRACCEELLHAVRRTAAGERVWRLGGKVGEPRSRVHATPGDARLTPKEREVLMLVLRGCSNTDIAGRLYLGLPTVKTHVRNVLRKLGVKSRRDLFQPRSLEAV